MGKDLALVRLAHWQEPGRTRTSLRSCGILRLCSGWHSLVLWMATSGALDDMLWAV